MTRLRSARWFALALIGPATALPAQTPGYQRMAPLPPSNDPADRLAANLLLLSQNPNDVGALTEAGLSAIAVGDGNAALAFLARAETLSPSNGRIKAGLGSALLLMEKPSDALKLYGEASALGVPDSEIARDRGLAHDLRGDPRRAQRDYALVLRDGADDETTRRYALSLGISGERDKALDMLDPLLRKQDRAAWRARAFIMAMTGDVPAAESLAMQIMPAGAGASMSPFLRKLASLNAAERALAVNLGIMPSEGTQYAMVQSGDPYRPAGAAGDGLIPAGNPFGPRPATVTPKPLEPSARVAPTRPGVAIAAATPQPPTGIASPTSAPTPSVRAPISNRVGARIGPVDPQMVDAALRPFLRPVQPQSPTLPQPGFTESPVTVTVQPTGLSELPPPSRASASIAPAPVITAQAEASPAPLFEVSQAGLQPTPAVQIPATTQPIKQPAAPALITAPQRAGLGAIIATIQPEAESAAGPLPDAAALRAARAALQKKAAAANKAEAAAKAEKDRKAAEQLVARRNPPRLWVQVATGANDAGLPLTWKRLRGKAPDALKGLSASSASYKATNRLLVGPFKSPAEAKKVVNGLSKSGVSAFTFSSEAGQEVAKVATK